MRNLEPLKNDNLYILFGLSILATIIFTILGMIE